MDRAIESPAVINAIAQLAHASVAGGFPPVNALDAIDTLQQAFAMTRAIPQPEQIQVQKGLSAMRSGMLRAVAVKSRDREAQDVVHASEGMEDVTGTTFLKTTELATKLLQRHGVDAASGYSEAKLGFMVGALEGEYRRTVAKVLKEEQQIDVVADAKAEMTVKATGSGGMSRTGDRISDPRTPPAATWAKPK